LRLPSSLSQWDFAFGKSAANPETPVPSAPPILLRVIDPQPAVTPNPAPAPILAPVQRPVPNNWAMKNNTAILINITFTYEKQKEHFIEEPQRRGL
jgi:hypothetical protein